MDNILKNSCKNNNNNLIIFSLFEKWMNLQVCFLRIKYLCGNSEKEMIKNFILQIKFLN